MIFIGSREREEIFRHARESSGSEACGILAGRGNRVEKIYRMTNASDTPENRYFMDPTEQFKIMKDIREKGWEMAGIYHSHPGAAAYPSARDIELAFYPEAVYVIVSLKINGATTELRAFRIIEGKIAEEEIDS